MNYENIEKIFFKFHFVELIKFENYGEKMYIPPTLM